jgi:hypothetical protein
MSVSRVLLLSENGFSAWTADPIADPIFEAALFSDGMFDSDGTEETADTTLAFEKRLLLSSASFAVMCLFPPGDLKSFNVIDVRDSPRLTVLFSFFDMAKQWPHVGTGAAVTFRSSGVKVPNKRSKILEARSKSSTAGMRALCADC